MTDRYLDKPGRPFGAEPTDDHPFVVDIFERPTTIIGVRNGLSFETAEDAQAYALDLSGRWLGFDHYTIVNAITGETVSL